VLPSAGLFAECSSYRPSGDSGYTPDSSQPSVSISFDSFVDAVLDAVLEAIAIRDAAEQPAAKKPARAKP
jgi:hypothetical protein